MFNEYATEKGLGPRLFYIEGSGFATYHIHKNGECYIEDIYVVKEKRKEKIASKMADEIAKIAKDHGCRILTGSVNLEINDFESSQKVLRAYGFKYAGTTDNVEAYAKELE
jgi:GNAT superfamily N-acetyltransferase